MNISGQRKRETDRYWSLMRVILFLANWRATHTRVNIWASNLLVAEEVGGVINNNLNSSLRYLSNDTHKALYCHENRIWG